MANSPERPITLFDILGAAWKYRVRVVATAAVTFVLGVIAIFLWPKKYESEAQLFVRLGRGSARLDTATVGQTISIQESREGEMNSIVNLLESRGLAEAVVDDLGVERILKKYAFIEVLLEGITDSIPSLGGGAVGDDDDPMALTQDEIDAGKRRDLAIKEFMSNLKIDLPKKSTTISVVYRGRTNKLAQVAVQSVVDQFQSMHLQAHQSTGSLSFFESQFAAQAQIVNDCENDLRLAKNEHGIVTLAHRQDSLREEFTETKKLQLAAKSEYEAALQRVSALEQDFADLPKTVNSERRKGIAENARDAMRDRLYDLEIREKELSAKFSDSHPQLVKVRSQLESARSILDDQPQEREQSVEAVNPVVIAVENELIKAKSELKATKARVDALSKLEGELRQRQEELNDLEVLSQELQRKIDLAKDNYNIYAKKLEEARINDALDQESLSNVTLVAPPTLHFKHSSPKRSLLAVLVLMLSGLSGVAVALISDYFDRAAESAQLREAEFSIYRSNVESELASRIESRDYPRDRLGEVTGRHDVSVADLEQQLSSAEIAKAK
ncbi:MAG: GumC family protein [Aureliella sp.]